MKLDQKLKDYFLELLGRLPDYKEQDKLGYFFFFEEGLQYNVYDGQWYECMWIDGKLSWRDPTTHNPKWESYEVTWKNAFGSTYNDVYEKPIKKISAEYNKFIYKKLEEALFA